MTYTNHQVISSGYTSIFIKSIEVGTIYFCSYDHWSGRHWQGESDLDDFPDPGDYLVTNIFIC